MRRTTIAGTIATTALAVAALALPGIPAAAIDLPLIGGSIEGRVVSADSFRSADGHILTEAVVETLLGSTTVVGRGGRVGEEWESVEHEPTLVPGALVSLDLDLVDGVLRVLGGSSSAGDGGSGAGGGAGPGPSEVSGDPVTGAGFTTLFDEGWCYRNLPADYVVESPVAGRRLLALRRGFSSWNAQRSSWVRFRYAGATVSQQIANDGVNRVVFNRHTTEGFLARAWTYGGSSGIVGFDIEVNTRYRFTTNGSGLDLETVARHEAGHALGLGHSPSRRNVMYPSVAPGEERGLGRGDRAGSRGLHPYRDYGVRVMERDPDGSVRILPGGRATVAVKLGNTGRTPWNGPFANVALHTDGPRNRNSRFFDAPTWISRTRPGGRITQLMCHGEVVVVRWAMKAPQKVERYREAFAVRIGHDWKTEEKPVWNVAVPI